MRGRTHADQVVRRSSPDQKSRPIGRLFVKRALQGDSIYESYPRRPANVAGNQMYEQEMRCKGVARDAL